MGVMTRRTTGFLTAGFSKRFGYGTCLTAAAVAAFGLSAALTSGGCAEAAAAQSAVGASQVAASAVTTTLAGAQQPANRPRQSTGVKFNGRGGYDVSEAQKMALKRAHWVRDHHNEVYRPSHPKPPSSQPSSRPS